MKTDPCDTTISSTATTTNLAMMLHLSIIVYGTGTDPEFRSHWAFAIHRPGDLATGHLLQVVPFDVPRRLYLFDERRDVPLMADASCEGAFRLAAIEQDYLAQTIRVIAQEPPPQTGVDRCQDWTLGAVIALEESQLVPDGSSERIARLVGCPAAEVAQIECASWISAASEASGTDQTATS